MKSDDEILNHLSKDYSPIGYNFRAMWHAADAEMRNRLQEAFPERFEDRTCKWRKPSDDFPNQGYYWRSDGKMGQIVDRDWFYCGNDGSYGIEETEFQYYGPLQAPEAP